VILTMADRAARAARAAAGTVTEKEVVVAVAMFQGPEAAGAIVAATSSSPPQRSTQSVVCIYCIYVDFCIWRGFIASSRRQQSHLLTLLL
jgi:hypothetical protein